MGEGCRIRRALVAIAFVGTWGCLRSNLETCGELTCPSGTRCVQNTVCATDGQIAACVGLADGEPCTVGGSVGRCELGVCIGSGCGNGVVDPGEVCDDGNQASGDGCRADCRKEEVCGDAIVDEGETCDDGNLNSADGCDTCVATVWRATAVVGGSIAATSVALTPNVVAIDRVGNALVSEGGRIHRVGTDGVIVRLAGVGPAGFSGDGGPATSAAINVNGIAVDGLGTVYIVDSVHNRVRRIDASGVIETIAGTGTAGFGGDDGAATAAELASPNGVAVDGLGNVYICDSQNSRIRKIDQGTGIITTFAGDGTFGFSGDGFPATQAQFANLTGVGVDGAGNVYIADASNERIRRVDTGGVIETIAGTGDFGLTGDGGPALSATLAFPLHLAVDDAGNVAMTDLVSQRVRRIDATTGQIDTITGSDVPGFSGDGNTALSAQLDQPRGLGFDQLGALYIADFGNFRVRRIDAVTQVIDTIAGKAVLGFSDDQPATSVPFPDPRGIAVDGTAVYVMELGTSQLRRIDLATGIITTAAGIAGNGFGGDGGPATAAELNNAFGVAVDAAGNLAIADSGNNRIRRIDATTGVITTIAGSTRGFFGENVDATTALLDGPTGLAFDAGGNLYFADGGNHRVRRIDATTNTITTVAGTGVAGALGDGGLAVNAQLSGPFDVAVDAGGAVFIADRGNHRIRRVDPTTLQIATVAGTTQGFFGDSGAATLARLSGPISVTLDPAGNLFISDRGNHRIRRVDATTQQISTIAGAPSPFSGDGGPPINGGISFLSFVEFGGGVLYVSEDTDQRIRRISPTQITTFAGLVDPDGMGALATARLADPRAFAAAPDFTLVAGGTSGTIQAIRATRVDAVAGRYPHGVATGNLARFRDSNFGVVSGIAYDAARSSIYITESSSHRIHVVSIPDPNDATTWTIAALANASGQPGFADGNALSAQFRNPTALYLDPTEQKLYVADTGNHIIRAIDLTGVAVVTTIAGTVATRGFAGDGEDARQALLFEPQAVLVCPATNDLFIADTGNHRVRKVNRQSGQITTVLGVGVGASAGEGSPSATFPVDAPLGLACDDLGNLFVTSRNAVRLVVANDAKVIDGTTAVQTIYGAPPRDRFPDNATRCLTGLSVIDATHVRVADSCSGIVVELAREAL